MNIQPTRFDLSEDITKLKEKEIINKTMGKICMIIYIIKK